ncbi:hypothetical protein PVK06_011689 [Gossypium arboreum]|uniref:Uncharacterized protein n=1 Tax=Gossypium arboreum TaxID=29729 RepID=A0ABR0Q9K9_GOSAR|nr:hypothetical protein PVK06_011689 [Gossypium arboreum]
MENTFPRLLDSTLRSHRQEWIYISLYVGSPKGGSSCHGYKLQNLGSYTGLDSSRMVGSYLTAANCNDNSGRNLELTHAVTF